MLKLKSIMMEILDVFKTHNAFLNVNNYNFTNKKNTNGCIYIARDPRHLFDALKEKSLENYEEALEQFQK